MSGGHPQGVPAQLKPSRLNARIPVPGFVVIGITTPEINNQFTVLGRGKGSAAGAYQRGLLNKLFTYWFETTFGITFNFHFRPPLVVFFKVAEAFDSDFVRTSFHKRRIVPGAAPCYEVAIALPVLKRC